MSPPPKAPCTWHDFEPVVRDALLRCDASEAMENDVTAQMRDHFTTLAAEVECARLDLRLAGPISAAQGETIAAATSKIVSRLMGSGAE